LFEIPQVAAAQKTRLAPLALRARASQLSSRLVLDDANAFARFKAKDLDSIEQQRWFIKVSNIS
jgi:hypothetical protein